MSYGPDDFKALLARRAETKAPARPVKRQAFLERAEIRLSALTNDTNWNEFLSMVEAEVEAARNDLESYRQMLEAPFTLDDLQVRSSKMGVALCQERIRTLEWAINLPKSIQDEVEDYAKLDTITNPHVPDRAKGASPGDS